MSVSPLDWKLPGRQVITSLGLHHCTRELVFSCVFVFQEQMNEGYRPIHIRQRYVLSPGGARWLVFQGGWGGESCGLEGVGPCQLSLLFNSRTLSESSGCRPAYLSISSEPSNPVYFPNLHVDVQEYPGDQNKMDSEFIDLHGSQLKVVQHTSVPSCPLGRVLTSSTVGCRSEVLVAQLCLTLCNSMDCSPPGSSVHGLLQARILEWVAIPFSRGFSPSRD